MTIIDKINEKNDETIVLYGDFNAAAPEFGSRTCTSAGKHLVEVITGSSLTYVSNDCPTFLDRATGSWNIIDYSFLSDKAADSLNSLEIDPPCESDHFATVLTMNLNFNTTKNVKNVVNWEVFKSLQQTDESLLKLKREMLNLEQLVDDHNIPITTACDEIDDSVDRLTSIINEIKSKATKTINRKINKEFKISSETRDKIKKRRNLATKIKINKDFIDTRFLKQEYNKITKEMKNLLWRDKQKSFEYKSEKIRTSKDSKQKWTIFNSLMGNRKTNNTPVTQLKRPDNSSTSSIKDIVEEHARRLKETHKPNIPSDAIRNWHEHVKRTVENNKDALQPKLPTTEDGDNWLDAFSLERVVDCIRILKTSSAPGDDGIDNLTLKNLLRDALESLVVLYRTAFKIGHFPRPWKRARIRMIPKAGKSPDLSCNYRPISLLSNLGKLFERLIKNCIDGDDKRFKFVPEIHSGFRKGRSTQENFIRVNEGFQSKRKSRKVVVGCFVDIDKAFDRLDHSVIQFRLLDAPLAAKTKRILASFIRDRTLYVQEGSTASSTIEMEAGAPQGAILSPTLYTLTSRDIPIINDDVNGGTQYADDSMCWSVGNNAADAVNNLQERIWILERWCKSWNITPSPVKSELIVITNSRQERDSAKKMIVKMNDIRVEWKESVKFLGLYIDEKMNWECHVNSIIKKCYPKVASICRLNRRMKFCNRKAVIDVFNSLVMSCFHYSGLAILNMPERIWLRVESFLCRSIKQIFDLPKCMSNERARGIFFCNSFRDQIEKFAIKRIHSMSNSSSMMQNLIAQYRDYAFKRGKDTLLDRTCKLCGLNDNSNCFLCFYGVEHNCVSPC